MERSIVLWVGGAVVVALAIVLFVAFAGGDELENKTWLLEEFASEEGMEDSGPPITARFEDANVQGSAGCNGYSAPYETDGDSITIGPAITTLIFCSDAVNDRESAYLATLDTVDTFGVDDDRLTLSSGGRAVLRYREVPPEVADAAWALESMGFNDGPAAPIQGAVPTMVVDEDGTIGGTTGCNSYSAAFTTDGSNVAIGPIATTRMFCPEPPGAMEQEQAYLVLLESMTTFARDDDQLLLMNATGESLTFRQALPG